MRRLSMGELDELVRSGTVLARNDDGGMTLRCEDGIYIKIFRRVSLFSSARVRSLAGRFIAAARELAKRGIATVEVIERCRVAESGMDAVRYRGLAGESLAERLRRAAADPLVRSALLKDFAKFLARLHANGVYFRGLRFDNVIANEGVFGLVDVAAARFRRVRLSPAERARNFRHFLRYDADRASLHAIGFADFLGWYLEAADLPPQDARRFLKKLTRVDSSLAAAIDQIAGGAL